MSGEQMLHVSTSDYLKGTELNLVKQESKFCGEAIVYVYKGSIKLKSEKREMPSMEHTKSGRYFVIGWQDSYPLQAGQIFL